MRFSINSLPEQTEHLSYDVVIIGSGIAGLYTALNIDEKYSCCIITKEDAQMSNSWLAQGGIAAAIAMDDKPTYHLDDTMLAGAGLCDEGAVEVLVSEGPREIKALQEMQVPFDLNEDGDLDITREGGHRHRRVVHAGGDATGRETVKVLAHIVSQCPNVTFMPYNFCTDFLTDSDDRLCGCIVLDRNDTPYIIDCSNIVVATGGIGQLYKKSTNPSVATGDGIAAAVRAGAKLKNMEFIQFHPTGLWTSSDQERSFLISEAVRGEGGILINTQGERFMLGRHELAELAPRDIVAREIFRELASTGENHVFVDITSESEEYLSKRFPTIYTECKEYGINISNDPIPVCPVQHYLIGGIETDLNAHTSVEGLYACGEAASTGVHGANRLASNSMLECLVFGRRAAEDINSRLDVSVSCANEFVRVESRTQAELDLDGIRSEIQDIMSAHCGVLRNEKGLKTALERMDVITQTLEKSAGKSRTYYETLNLAEIAQTILTSALARKDSVGAHYRED